MNSGQKLSFGFNKPASNSASLAPKKTFKLATAASKPKPSAFGALNDDDDDDQPPKPSTSKHLQNQQKGPRVSTASLTKAQKAKQAADIALDSSVYEYDEVYDKMKAGERMAEQERKKEAGDRQPKYINKLMETAEVRKRDRVRAEDKMVQMEREREGDEFKDKDQFVTPAYLAQQEELRRLEEEEKRKEEASAGKAGTGMSNFLKSYLDTTSKAHDAAVAASLSKEETSFTIAPPKPQEKEKTDVQLAAELAATTGRRVELNDDGQIIDHRELLAGGLNIIAKPKPNGGGGFSAPINARTANADRNSAFSSSDASKIDSLLNPSGLSAAERGRQARERQSREVERQMVALEERRKREAEEALESKVQKVAKRNDESKVEELKRKAEERRKKREEDAKVAKEAANTGNP
ncbi:hypothetical protein T439DRAFT_324354 [Meredithblackwellia eburnea MCA 4105]